jgi:membrane protease YdiL (CAAX protease family)
MENRADPLLPVEPGTGESLAAPSGYQRRLNALFEVLLCSGVPTQLALGGLLLALGLGPGAEGRPSLPFVVTLLLADTALVLTLIVVFMRAQGESAAALWLGARRVRIEAIYGLALIPPIFFAVVVLLNALRLAAPWLQNVPVNPFEEMAAGGSANAALLGLAAILAGGVREELQRAFLLHRFEQHLGGAAVGVIVLSIAFGLGHINQGWDAGITTGILGAFWAVVYLRRRSSVAPVVSHAGFNALEVLRVGVMG